jgi:nucleotide-binding universal stress UspA family protein
MPCIVLATDGSPDANRALDMAARLAKGMRCELVILTIGGDITSAELRELASAEGNLTDTLQSAAKDILIRAEKRARRCGVSDVRLQTGWGDPAQTILNSVRREKAGILVVGRRGRSRLSGLLLGSVSQKLTSLAPCPVLVVP